MNRKEIVDYRTLYEQSVFMLQCNILKDIATLVAGFGLLNFKKKNQFSFGDKKITGVLLQENGMFILNGKKMFEINENDESFVEFAKSIYNLISLYESVLKELGIKIEK